MTFKICKEGSWDVQFLERSPAIPSNMKFPIAVRNPMRTWGNTNFKHGSAQGPLDQLLQLGAKVSALLLHVCGFCPHPMDAGPSFSPVPVVTSKPCWLLFSASRHWKGKNAKEKDAAKLLDKNPCNDNEKSRGKPKHKQPAASEQQQLEQVFFW